VQKIPDSDIDSLETLLDRSYFYRQTIKNVIISKRTLFDKEFEECTFSKISFTVCRFERCKFIDCKFNESILSAIKPIDSVFRNVEFTNSKVIGLDWTMSKNIDSFTFKSCQINYSNFRFLKLPKSKFFNCIAKDVDFTEADLSGSDFSGTDFENSRFFKTNLFGCDLRNAKNYYIDIKTNNIRKAKFSYPEALNLLGSLDIEVEY
jgi:fluoroquinolone resistance protein